MLWTALAMSITSLGSRFLCAAPCPRQIHSTSNTPSPYCISESGALTPGGGRYTRAAIPTVYSTFLLLAVSYRFKVGF